MPSRYQTFDRGRLTLLPLAQRQHDVTVQSLLVPPAGGEGFDHPHLRALAEAMAGARRSGSARVLMMGAHVIKQGLSRYVIDMLRRGQLDCLACNGACAIHDYELARVGATSESVARYILDGRFGLWRETGEINDIVSAAAGEGLGFGEALGRAVLEGDLPHKDASIFAAAYECGVPVTVHLGIGYDIIHQHPNFEPAPAAAASYHDFLVFTRVLERLAGGVLLCFGSAVMGPEVFLKALSMVRNAAAREGRQVRGFTTGVFDLLTLGEDLSAEASKDSPEYYYRPYKTILVRTVRDGGRGYYVRGEHRQTMPALHRLMLQADEGVRR